MCMVWPCHSFVHVLSKKCIKKSHINESCLSAYFNAVVYNAVCNACLLNAVYSACLLNAALSNAVCLYNASFLPMISANAFYFHVLSWFIDT